MKLFARSLLTADLRTLGIFRIWLGLVLVVNCVSKLSAVGTFLSNDGVLPNHYNLFRPIAPAWSILNAFTLAAEVRWVLYGFILLFILFTIGYGGRAVRFLVFIAVVSLAGRNIMIRGTADSLLCLLSFWSLLLPLEERFSIRSWANGGWDSFVSWLYRSCKPGRYRGIGALGMIISISLVLLSSFLSKETETWANGSAVHYLLWQNGIVSDFGIWIRSLASPERLQLLARWIQMVEGIVPLLLILPIMVLGARRLALFLLASYVMIIFSLTNTWPLWGALFAMVLFLLQSADWEKLLGTSHTEEEVIGFQITSILATTSRLLLVFVGVGIIYVQSSSIFERRSPDASEKPDSVLQISNLLEYLSIPRQWSILTNSGDRVVRHIVYTGEMSGRQVDLESLNDFDPIKTDLLERYFEGAMHLRSDRVEWDSWVPKLDGDEQKFLIENLTRRFGQFSHFKVYLLERRSPPPGSGKGGGVQTRLLVGGPIS